MSNICLVIPCYNEALRLPIAEYKSFIEATADTLLCFVNDGSKDNTLTILQDLEKQYPNKVKVVSKERNLGKAEAVRTGMQYCFTHTNSAYFGYCDADLSTELEEVAGLKKHMSGNVEFCFGSRILIIGSVIERSGKRHYIGRIIATFISTMLDVKVYDTQCGCKFFTKDIAVYLFEAPFISKWLFDVELFARMLNKYGKQKALGKIREIPLKKWINREGSKVKISYFFKLWIDMLKIKKICRPKKVDYL